MTEMLRWTPTLFEAQAGAFSSSKRYIRKAASGGYALSSGGSVTGRYWYIGSTTKGVTFACKIGTVRDWKGIPLAGASYPPAVPAPELQTVEI